jgi:predicted patatin/cPLA2 family phospholipase
VKVGLVLEGGAMRGLYTAGVLDAFMDYDVKVDGIMGVSAGALFGVNYPSKQRGRTLRYNKKYVNDKRYMGLGSLIKTGNIINKEFAYYEIPFKLDKFDEETFEKSGIDFYAVVTNVETGKAEYPLIKNCEKEIEMLRASSCMPIVSSNYWNGVFGSTKEEVQKDEEGLQTMRTLGNNMAWLIKCINCGKKEGIEFPNMEKKIFTSFWKEDN